MTTLLIATTDPPAALRAIIERGSTAVVSRRPQEVDIVANEARDADRVVFWAAQRDSAVTNLAQAWIAREGRGTGQLLFISASADASPGGLSSDALFEWPRDEDRLRIAFMTGA